MKKKIFRNMDWGIVLCVFLLLTVGLIALFSSTDSTNHVEFKRQLVWLLISIPVAIVCILVNYDFIAKVSPILYVLILLALIAVLFTSSINGASSWFSIGGVSFQPSEFAKIIVILFLSLFISRRQQKGDKGKDEISRFVVILETLLILGIPVGIIVLQPDIGTATAFIFAYTAIIFVSGIKKRYIFAAIILVAVSLPLIYYYVLPDYSKTRINVFLNPELDPRGAGYNAIQSKLAIGAGEFVGMGVLKGNQTQLGFLYPKTTDFIFSVISEEMGFVVAGSLIFVYVVLITRCIYIAKTAKDRLGAYICMGVAGVLIFHMTENIGMTMGLLPITGVPLPFVSYGGSSLMSNLIMIALVVNVSGRRQKAIFIN